MGSLRKRSVFLLLLLCLLLSLANSAEISSCGTEISSSGSYSLSKNISGSSINIQNVYLACLKVSSSHVSIDCANFSITESSPGKTVGIFVQGLVRNVTIRNCKSLSGFETGIYLSGALDGGISGSNITGNINGIRLISSENFNLTESNVSGNVIGLYSYFGERNFAVGNIFSRNRLVGIKVEGPTAQRLPGQGNFFFWNNVSGSEQGFEITRANGNLLIGNQISNSSMYGIRIAYSRDNNISLNAISGSKRVGLFLDTSSGNLFSCNNFSGNLVDIDTYYANENLGNASCDGANVTIGTPQNQTRTTAQLTTIPACACTPWVSRGCNTGSCQYGSEFSERSCAPAGCASEKTCIINAYCYRQIPLENAPQTSVPIESSCPANCDDSNPCTVDSCSEETGFNCRHASLPEGASCGKDLFCKATSECAQKSEPQQSCPACSEPGAWSGCLDGVHSRTIQICGQETGYFCVPYIERGACLLPAQTTVPAATAPPSSCRENSECPATNVCSGGQCVPAKLVLVFVPLNWTGSAQSFSEEADRQANFLLANLPLSGCPEKVKILKGTEPCAAQISCKYCGEALSIRSCAKRVSASVDIAIGLTNLDSLCKTEIRGFSCGAGGVFVKSGGSEVLAHEVGHEFGLRDEYCNYGTRCGEFAAPNPLRAEYGCNPSDANCCWCSGSYSVCCYGNVNEFGGRSIMSYAGAPAPRAFDYPALAHLKSLEKLRCN
ncbi:MAG: NosD domain-containing protein [archaeon]